MRLIFIRHAEPDYSIDSLTEKGWREAKLLAERTKRWRVDEFYCSPLGRAKDTASFTLKECGREAVTCDWMREFDACVVDPETGKNRPLLFLRFLFFNVTIHIYKTAPRCRRNQWATFIIIGSLSGLLMTKSVCSAAKSTGL